MNAVKCDILMASFGEISQAMFEYNYRTKDKDPYDVVFYLIKKICRFDGKKQSEEYIHDLPGECYGQISVFVTEIVSSII